MWQPQIAVSAFFGAATSSLMIAFSDELVVTYTWLIGGLSGRGWNDFNLLWPYSLSGLLLGILLSPALNLFSLGDDVGRSLGLSVGVYRAGSIFVAAWLAGSAVSVAGTVGFVGLIAPHAARLLVGEDSRYMLPLSALLGGLLLLIADTTARTAFLPVELPLAYSPQPWARHSSSFCYAAAGDEDDPGQLRSHDPTAGVAELHVHAMLRISRSCVQPVGVQLVHPSSRGTGAAPITNAVSLRRTDGP